MHKTVVEKIRKDYWRGKRERERDNGTRGRLEVGKGDNEVRGKGERSEGRKIIGRGKERREDERERERNTS